MAASDLNLIRIVERFRRLIEGDAVVAAGSPAVWRSTAQGLYGRSWFADESH
jgi:hypothetical protein